MLHAAELPTSGHEAESVADAGGDPLVVDHRRQLMDADILVVAHPNWWGKPPAMMAGWIDRVLVPGVAYRLSRGEGTPQPLLGLTQVLVLNTSDTPEDREQQVFGDPLDSIWRRCVGEYLPSARVDRLVAGPMASSTERGRVQWLDQVERLAGRQPG